MGILVPMDASHGLTSHEGLGRRARDDDRIGLHVIRMDRECRVLPPQDEPAASLGRDGVPVVRSCMCIPIRTFEARRCLEETQSGVEGHVDEEVFHLLGAECVGHLSWGADGVGKLRYLFVVILLRHSVFAAGRWLLLLPMLLGLHVGR